ncbi:MAG: 1-(5-phosphoribosyl)-5-[(5-phosphoribosylamino)methylideneamino]imidazole-4-carboxamide isomerase [Gammaproteobacteria bacterium]|jgi:phosphoribosylformimino-5-aminoimidazole carboxamide ribotide isomerase|nr:1-(5-phosphoribosyl)-5-[(5-phosphoribosylamino)methylideneamino]imidazole-4-carboxamide isomerase [Gammaproteobacteria bacterium]
MEVIPAIDLLDGQCVRLYQGDFSKVSGYSQDPVALAGAYRDAGMQRLHVVDLDGARTGSPANMELIKAMAAGGGLAVQAGGGIRDLQRARQLREAGATRVVLGSIAAEKPETALAWLAELGAEHVVFAFDVRVPERGDPQMLTRGWIQDSGLSLWTLLARFSAHGGIHFLCTDIARDGTLGGPNLELYAECTRRFPDAQLIASGGVSSLADLQALKQTGVAAVVTGKALLDGRLTLEEIRQFSRDA